jgi:hypothetical protein
MGRMLLPVWCVDDYDKVTISAAIPGRSGQARSPVAHLLNRCLQRITPLLSK